MKNYEVAELLRNIAQLLEIKNELVFKIMAYEKAALVIENLDEDIEDVWKKGKLDDIPGVGEALTKKISEFLETAAERIACIRDGIQKRLAVMDELLF